MGFGERLKAARLAKGLSQIKLAKLIGVKQPSLSLLESGDSKLPAAPTLQALAKTLNVSPEWLLTGRGEMTPPLQPTISESELIAIWRELHPEGRSELIGYARGLLAAHNHAPSPTSPFPGAVAPTKHPSRRAAEPAPTRAPDRAKTPARPKSQGGDRSNG